MPNPDATRHYWQDYRAGRYDALVFGVIAIDNHIKQHTCSSGYIAGVQSIKTLAKRVKGAQTTYTEDDGNRVIMNPNDAAIEYAFKRAREVTNGNEN